MIRSLLAAAALASAVSASAAVSPLQARFAAQAAALGAPLAADFEFVAPAAVKAPPLLRKASEDKSRVTGEGWVSGSGWAHCSASRPNDSGFYTGSVHLSGNVRVRDTDGATGQGYVDGWVTLGGSCRYGGHGWVSGWTRVSGRVQLYKDGQAAGAAWVEASGYLNRYVSGGFVSFNEYVNVTGWR